MAKAGSKQVAKGDSGKAFPGYFKGVRADGWNNVFTGAGFKGKDKTLGTGFAARNPLDPETLRALYRFNGLLRRVVDLPAKEMTRAGFDVHEDPDGHCNAKFQELGIHRQVRHLIRWANLFGGALGVMGADDGRQFDKPLNEKGIRNLHFLHTFHRWRVTWNWHDLYSDPRHPKYGSPQWYEVTPVWGMPFRVHESRCVRMDGLPVDDLTQMENNDWGDSVVEACYEEFADLGHSYKATRVIMEDFIQSVISMKGLSSHIEGGNESVVKKRLDILDQSRHVLHTLLLDADGETYQKHASSVAGLADLLDRFAQKASAVTGIPVTLLMGEAPAGLNATGDGQRDNWYDDVKDLQEEKLQPVYERLCQMVFLSKEGEFGGTEPEGWEIKFRPLRQPTPKEKADMDKVKADTAKAYVDMGSLDSNEVRHSQQVEDFLGQPVEGDLEFKDDEEALAAAEAALAAGGAGAVPPAKPKPKAVKKDSKRKGRRG